MGLRRLCMGLACFASAALLAGCFLKPEHDEGEALREGLDVRVGGIDYNVFMTRELNPVGLPDDRAYWRGPEAEPGYAYYGVFLQACNRSDEDPELEDGTYRAVEEFAVVDTQGNEYRPLDPERNNPFHYEPEDLAPAECIPALGSVAQQGPTAGALIVFELPLEAGENRPLELRIIGDDVAVEGQPDVGLVELDL